MPSPVAKSLGIFLDAHLSMIQQATAVCGTCIGLMRRLRKWTPLLSHSSLHSVVSATIMSRLDYRNSLYDGFSKRMPDRLQVAMNDAARLLDKLPRSSNASLLLSFTVVYILCLISSRLRCMAIVHY